MTHISMELNEKYRSKAIHLGPLNLGQGCQKQYCKQIPSSIRDIGKTVYINNKRMKIHIHLATYTDIIEMD